MDQTIAYPFPWSPVMREIPKDDSEKSAYNKAKGHKAINITIIPPKPIPDGIGNK